MSTRPAPTTAPPTPPADPEADWTTAEEAWFKKNNITEDKEKEIIRGRARVLAYDRERRKFEEKGTPSEPPAKKWYDDL